MTPTREQQKVIMACNLDKDLGQAINDCGADRLFILTDETTQRLCWPVVQHYDCLKEARAITIPAGDTNKGLKAVCHVWDELQSQGATRHSLMVNLGGGMVTDLGGFAASTFKRGVHFINIPTTLLSMVDASVGGKTGINYGGLKNEIGVFNNAEAVLLTTTFLHTLDQENILSGYAEMLKHGLISNHAHWADLIRFDPQNPQNPQNPQHPQNPQNPQNPQHPQNPQNPQGMQSLQTLLAYSVAVKQRIVSEDPTEKGIRKALNLGHTIGHAFEALSLSQRTSPADCPPKGPHAPILHGYAVAYGLVCELYLSVVKTGFPQDKMRQTVNFIHEHYGRMPITCDDYPTLLELMTHDKKNTAGNINFTLLSDIGDIRINQTATKEEIAEALDFYREGL